MPGHLTCCVKNCKNTYLTYTSEKLSFHRFPKDALIKQKWIDFCGYSGDWIPKTSDRICSVHFKKSDYEINFKEQLLHTESKRRLLKNVVPSKRSRRESSYDDEDEHETYQQETPLTPEQEYEVETITVNFDDDSSVLDDNEEIMELKHELARMRDKLKEQESLNDQLKSYIITMGNQLSEERNRTTKLDKIIENQREELSKSISPGEFNQKIKESLTGTLSSAQLDSLLKIKKKVKWSRDDILTAITLRYFSKRAYSFLKNNNFPLPNLRTVQLYCRKMNVSSGMLVDVLKFMGIAAESMSKKERAVALSYDEIKVSTLYEYDEIRDEVVGPHKSVQVVMVRSLFGHWKQPVYVTFDKSMSSTLLMEVIVALHEISYEVVAIVGYCGPSNQRIVSNLGVDIDRVHFEHPVTQKNIYCFADSPQLLKILGNSFLRTGFKLASGKMITKELLEDMFHKFKELEISSLHNLSEHHFNCTDSPDEQNIELVRQLLSQSTATAMRGYYSSEESETVVQFIHLTNDWFEIMSSRNSKEKPYESSESQNQNLEEMFQFISTMKCFGKTDLQRFQKLMLISIRSLQGLFAEMKKEYQIEYILTSKLNQGALEDLFGILRSRGRSDDHLSPMNIINRLRMVSLEKIPGTNTLPCEDNEETILSSSILGKAEITLVPPENSEEVEKLDYSVSPSETLTNEYMEKDAVEDLSGWLANKFNKLFPDSLTMKHEHSYAKPTHVGSAEPSTKLRKCVEILDNEFHKINKSTFVAKKNIVKRLLKCLKDEVEIPVQVTEAFIKQRILIRMKKLNRKKFVGKTNRGKSKTVSKLKKLS